MKPRNVALILGALLTLVIALGSVVAWSYLFRSSWHLLFLRTASCWQRVDGMA
jgi:hypothetical protein